MRYQERGFSDRGTEKNVGVMRTDKVNPDRAAFLTILKDTPKQRAETKRKNSRHAVLEDATVVLQEYHFREWVKKSENIEKFDPEMDQIELQTLRNEYFYVLKMKTGEFILVVRPTYAEDQAVLQNLEEILSLEDEGESIYGVKIKHIEGFPAIFIPQGLEHNFIYDLQKKFPIALKPFQD